MNRDLRKENEENDFMKNDHFEIIQWACNEGLFSTNHCTSHTNNDYSCCICCR